MLPATAAGPLMAILDDRYRLEQVLCPSCGALFDTQLVEENRQLLSQSEFAGTSPSLEERVREVSFAIARELTPVQPCDFATVVGEPIDGSTVAGIRADIKTAAQ